MKGWITRLALAGAVIVIGVGLLATSGAGQTNGPPAPQTPARLTLLVEGADVGSFSELVGITNEADLSQYVATDARGTVTRTAQPVQRPSMLVLRRSHGADRSLWTWYEEARRGIPGGYRDAVLEIHDPRGKPLARHTLVGAWPAKLQVSALTPGDSTLYETVTLVTDDLRRGTT